MDNLDLEKAELITSIRHIARFPKSGIPIYNSEVPDTANNTDKNQAKNTGSCKAFCVLHKRNNAKMIRINIKRNYILPHFIHFSKQMLLFISVEGDI